MDRVTGSAPGPEGSAVQVYASASSDSGDVKLYMKDSTGYESVVGGGFSLEDGDGTELNITGGAQLKFIEGGAIDINWSDVSDGIDGDEYDLTFTLDIQNLTETTTVADGDLVVIDDGAGGTLRKMTRANFIESAALDSINIDGGAIDGTPIGANSRAAGNFTTLDANGNVDLGSDSSDTITANGQFDSDLVPSSDDARDLGSSAKEWKDLYLDGVAYIDSLQADQLGAALDANSQAITNINVDSGNIDGTAIGSNSASTAKVTSLTASLGALFQDSVRIEGDLEVQGAVNTVTNHETELHIADKFILIASGATAGNTDGAGILLGDASSPHAKLVWDHGDDRWHTPDGLHVSGAAQLDGNVTLGSDENDVVTVSGELTASLGLSLPDDKKLYFGTGFDASIEYDEDGTDELRFAGAAVTFEQDASFDANVVLGNATSDTITATGQFASDLVPSGDDARDLGSSAKEWKDLYLDGVAYIDDLRADQLGAALDANSQAITNINVDSGAIDGVTLGGNAQVTITDADMNGGSIDGVPIGAASPSTVVATTVTVNTRLVPDAAGGADLGSADLEFGDVYIADDKKIYFGSGQDASFEYDEDGTDTLLYAGANMRISDDVKLEFGTGGDASFEYDEDGNDVLLYAGANMRFGDDIKLEFGAGGDATIEYDEDGTDELRFAGAAVTFEQAVSMDANVTLGNAASDITTVTGKLSGSNGMAISGDAVIIGTTSLSGTVAFVGGYTSNADAGMSFNAANGNLTSRGAFQADGGLTTAGNASVTGNSTFGGGYGSTGVTISTAGNIQANGALTVDTTSTLSGQVTVGGGYGSSGVTLSAAGVVSMDGALTVGSDGAGADFKVFGGAANEYLLYDVSENLLQMADSSGTVLLSIGGDASTEYAIDVADGANNANRIRAASFVTYSDESLKTDIETMDNAVDTIKKLRGVNFTWTKDNSQDFGFIAQEVKNVVPEVVHTDSDGTSGVDYSRLTSILVEAVKEQQQQIDELKNLLDD